MRIHALLTTFAHPPFTIMGPLRANTAQYKACTTRQRDDIGHAMIVEIEKSQPNNYRG